MDVGVNWFGGIFNMLSVAFIMFIGLLAYYVISFLWEFIIEPLFDWLLDKLFDKLGD